VSVALEKFNFHYTVNEDARIVSIAYQQRYKPTSSDGTNITVSSSNNSMETMIYNYQDFYNLKSRDAYDVGKNVASNLILAWIKDNHPEELV
jgi:hypothetical protein